MKKYLSALLFTLQAVILFGQYKNDNVLYKTVYPQDLSNELKANPGYLLLDVRSKGEYSDTSSMGMNIGRLNNALNISVSELGNHLDQLNNYKDKPVFVYCSHSQRSRRASKMLADSGFTKVFNINGGLTTLIQTEGAIAGLYQTKNRFTYLSPAQFCIYVNDPKSYIIDLRSDSSFRSLGKDKIMGRIRNAHNIPAAQLADQLSSVPINKDILLVDAYGDDVPSAASLLASKGFQNVYALFDGLLNLAGSSPGDASCKKSLWESTSRYSLISPEELQQMMQTFPALDILDVRTAEEFANKSKDNWRNGGHIKNAKNIPSKEIVNHWSELAPLKNKPVIIYSISSDDAGYDAANSLIAKGFSHVYLLSGGLFNIRWQAANIKGKSSLKDMVTNIPAENL